MTEVINLEDEVEPRMLELKALQQGAIAIAENGLGRERVISLLYMMDSIMEGIDDAVRVFANGVKRRAAERCEANETPINDCSRRPWGHEPGVTPDC